MPDALLRDRRVLVVEDEYMLADELSGALANAGAVVLGPAADVADAMAIIGREAVIDGAVLDANLKGEMVFATADRLARRGVPFIFTTGYDAAAFPPRFEHVERFEKPVDIARLTQAISRAIQA